MENTSDERPKVQYSVASAPVITAWLRECYDLGDPVACELFRPGWPTLYRVESQLGMVWLRVFATGRPDVVTADAQARAIHGLTLRGAPATPPLARRDGGFAGAIDLPEGQVAALLFSDAPGREPSRPNDTECFGESLGRFHAAGLACPEQAGLPTIDAEWLWRRPLARLTSWPASAVVLPDVQTTAAIMADRVWGSGGSLPIGVCHGDVHLGNARVADGRVTFFDFDVSGAGPIAYDLGCYWRQCILAHDDLHAAELDWHAFLRGYTRVRSISDDELRVVPALAALRAIWTMAMPTEFADVWGTDMLRDPSYFEAHLSMIRRIAAAEPSASPT